MKKKEDVRFVKTIHIKAEKAVKSAVAKAISEHQRTGDAIAVWKDGKVVYVTAKQLKTTKKRLAS